MNLSDLTPERRRVMLAEAAGWKPTRETRVPFRKIWIRDDGGGDYWAVDDLPDYDTSLYACHDLESKLTHEQCATYQARLTELIASDVYEMDGELPCPAYEYWFHASASQRASALLLAIYSEINL